MATDIGRFGSIDAQTTADAPTEDQKTPELVFGSAEEFIHEQLLPTYVRDVDGRAAKCCIEWYYHPEAVSRTEALWRAWEHLRPDPATGISVWFKDHADQHMRVMLDPRGPFYRRDIYKHRDPEYFELRRAPSGWFPDVRIAK